jgi:hypothetical protein
MVSLIRIMTAAIHADLGKIVCSTASRGYVRSCNSELSLFGKLYPSLCWCVGMFSGGVLTPRFRCFYVRT